MRWWIQKTHIILKSINSLIHFKTKKAILKFRRINVVKKKRQQKCLLKKKYNYIIIIPIRNLLFGVYFEIPVW